jgi:NAD(P)-dependent dehydrogenase (short-subunit alcohol dehydrogenase family)
MDLMLTGKRALVTGASSGIGAAIARWLAGEGVQVAVGGRDRARTEAVVEVILADGGSAVPAIGDVAFDDGAHDVAESAIGACGGIDILVNNAGGPSNQHGSTDWMEADATDWLDTYSKNTVASVRLIQRLAPAMKQRRWGRLIQMSSATANYPSSRVSHYAASKASILNLTMSAAQAFARTGVTANTVSPGLIQTPSVDRWLERVAEDHGWQHDRARTESWVVTTARPQTVNRIGTVDDVASAVTYLCSPMADFINGANIRVDGGSASAIN